MWRVKRGRSKPEQVVALGSLDGAPVIGSAHSEPAPSTTDWSIDVPAPGRIDPRSIRRAAGRVGSLLILSVRAPRPPASLAGLLAALWAAVVGWLLCGAAVLAGAVTDPGTPLVSQVWLVAHHATLLTPAGAVTLLPLGFLVFTLLPLRRAGRFVAAGDMPRTRVAASVALAGYVALAGMVALTTPGPPNVPLASAVFWSLLVALIAGMWGVVRQRRGRIPLPPFVLGVVVSVGVPLAVAAILVLVVGGTNWGPIADQQDAITTSGGEQLALVGLQLAYLPNLVVWAAAFVIGSGFTLGADHVLSPYSAAPPVVPDLPILAAIPADVPTWTAVLPIVVAVSGALGAVVFARRLPEPQLRRRIARALALAAVAGAVWWGLAAVAGGSLGDGRLDHLGPAAGTAGLAAADPGRLPAVGPTPHARARPVAVDLRDRVASAAKDPRVPLVKRG
ncbi:MAG: DUF6350 family protein [Candidatus Nanopelagicales bacterium]